MTHLLHNTRGLILRVVKYGETSIIVSAYTHTFGLQSYIINGVRASTKKGSGRGNMFQPGALLDMVVYYNEFKNLHRIKEFQWAHLYQSIFQEVRKNAVAIFMVEVILKCIKQQEVNEELYDFLEDCFLVLDGADHKIAANLPLFFLIHFPVFLGLRISDGASDGDVIDFAEGVFTSHIPRHEFYIQGEGVPILSTILKAQQPQELEGLLLNQSMRQYLLQMLEAYYQYHISDFGSLKCLPVLNQVFS